MKRSNMSMPYQEQLMVDGEERRDTADLAHDWLTTARDSKYGVSDCVLKSRKTHDSSRLATSVLLTVQHSKSDGFCFSGGEPGGCKPLPLG